MYTLSYLVKTTKLMPNVKFRKWYQLWKPLYVSEQIRHTSWELVSISLSEDEGHWLIANMNAPMTEPSNRVIRKLLGRGSISVDSIRSIEVESGSHGCSFHTAT
jgi:hypothetical protein